MAEKKLDLFQPKYRPDIDGLRAIAVLAVVIFHSFPNSLQGGFVGVDVFFVISGYLISIIIFENLDKGTFTFSKFYARRIKRIFPALILVLSCCFVFGWFALLADEYKQLGKHIAAGAGFISNLVLWSEAGYFDNSAETKPLLHLWSLGIEEQFYIIWPLLLWLAWKQKFSLVKIIIIVSICSFILNIKGVKQDVVAAFYSPQSRFWELLSGSLLAWITIHKKDFLNSLKNKDSIWISWIIYPNKESANKILANIFSIVGLLLLIYGFWRINRALSFPGKWALVPILGTLMIIAAGSKAWVNRTILSNKIAVWFGLISFPLYLWHWPLLTFARIIESELPSPNIRISALALSVVLAWLTYHLVERPIRFGKHGTVKVLVLIILMAIVGSLGYHTYTKEGYEFRNSIKGLVNNKNELVRTPAVDEECLNYTELKKPLFAYCRFTNVNSDETVAIIGDSHAHVAYPGISQYLSSKDINTILLANSGCPPFIGSYTGNNQKEKNACRDQIEQLLDAVISHKDIRKVFIITRGSIYHTGTEPLTKNQDATGGNLIPITQFANSAQLSVNKLTDNGKLVFYVTENPELNYSIESCLSRPFKSEVSNCSIKRKVVLERQSDYLNAFNKLKNVTIINSLEAFCPQNDCVVFDENGSLLYADDDHLSVSGSKFLVDRLLKRYLD